MEHTGADEHRIRLAMCGALPRDDAPPGQRIYEVRKRFPFA
jgi:hypothetical protein